MADGRDARDVAFPPALFLFDEHVRYPLYLAPARALHVSALADQRTAGVLMLVAGGVVMGVLAIVIAMNAMLAEERRQQRRDRYADAEHRVAGCGSWRADETPADDDSWRSCAARSR